MPICDYCDQYCANNQSYSAHVNNYCYEIKRQRRQEEREYQQAREDKIRREAEDILKKQQEDAAKNLEEQRVRLQLIHAKGLLHERQQNDINIQNQLTEIKQLLFSGHEKLDSHTEKLEQIAYQQKQMLMMIDNIINESYIYFIEQLKIYIEHCKKHNKRCNLQDLENVIDKSNWKHKYILNCIKTKDARFDVEISSDEEKQLIMVLRPIWKPQIQQHLDTILTLLNANF